MRILLIGCLQSSEIFFKRLIKMKANIVGVITKQKSDFNADFVDLGILCKKYHIDFIYVKNVNEDKAKTFIKNKNVDLMLCLGWSQLLKKEVLTLPLIGCLGFHPAKLPNNKGRHPIIWALALGLSETASTFFLMDVGADTGDIISQRLLPIDYEDNAATLYEKIMNVASEQLEDIILNFMDGKINPIPQSSDKSNSWRKRGKKDGEIDWRMSSKSIYNLVRALTKPYVGAHFVYENTEYKVWKVRELPEDGYENIEPGKVISINPNGGPLVKTGSGLIEILNADDINIRPGIYL